MASLPSLHTGCRFQALPNLHTSQFLAPHSLLKLKKAERAALPILRFSNLRNRRIHPRPFICAAQSNLLKVVQTVWKVGKNGIEAGTNMVPDPIPRPIARVSVALVAVSLASFVLKSFLSTVFFGLAVMGVLYFTFLALTKDEGPIADGEGKSTEDSLEEARRIMEKYK
ncbi:unnamed protein product [Cuscuta epithymum]|uniref:Uncharacterized protein n=1 Tax=Cuscuta epithymum TaxID=186058 RepID=A0AAV0CF96_9ASTE|nr:unnamed protein product [Cuscuta epithymum]